MRAGLGLLVLCAGCSRFQHPQYETVYVSAPQTYIHDRVAAVSDRVAEVVNGQPLQVLEHGRRFLKVQTEKKQVGWIEERFVIDAKTYASFLQLAAEHKDDPAAATATLRDILYMHLVPGRETARFYLLPGNAKVQLLARASVPKVATQGLSRVPGLPGAKPPAPGKPSVPAGSVPALPSRPAATAGQPEAAATPAAAVPAAPVAMEDWWLARDSLGHVGWLLGRGFDVDVPDEIAEYGEGQRFVGSWVLSSVTDSQATTADHQKPEYLTVLAPPGSGLPFDFDQVRVFTWNTRHHRYEAAFRLHPIWGFLPVRVTGQSAGGGVPSFSFMVAVGQNLTTDAATGITRPANARTIRYEMVNNRIQRAGPDMGPVPLIRQHEGDKKSKDKKAEKKRRR